MDVSIFLAKIVGLSYLIFGITLYINRARFRSLLEDYIAHPALVLIGGFFNLLLGILIIVSHNIWVDDWRVIITIIGWLLFIRGIVWLVIPAMMVRWVARFTRGDENNKPMYIASFIALILGLILCYYGFN